MKRFLSHLGVKITALFLLIITLVGTVFSGVIVFLGAGYGIYSHSVNDFYDFSLCSNTVWGDAERALDIYHYEENAEQYLDTVFDPQKTNLSLTIYSGNRNILYSNKKTIHAVGYESDLTLYRDNNTYIVRCVLDDPLEVEDHYQEYARLFEWMQSMRYTIFWICGSFGLIALILMIFLLCSAGHRGNAEGVQFNHQDKIPLDLYIVLEVFAVFLIASIYPGWRYYISFITQYIIFSAVISGIAIILIPFWMTLATRIKMGKWWRNTLIYRLLRLIWRAIRVIIHSMPLVWKAVLAFVGYLLINLGLLVAMFSSWAFASVVLWFLLWFIFNMAVLSLLCVVCINLTRLKKGGEKLAAGDLDSRVDTRKMFWTFQRHGENLNQIREGMTRAVEERLKSERLKTELITNVSHDLKTPLTSIINYIDLLKRESMPNQEAEQYLDVLDRQSQRLKKLTEDLVEASKASTGNIAVSLRSTDAAELVSQAMGEYMERFEKAHLEPILTVPQTPVYILADGRLLWRVLDNLFVNVCHYAQSGTRVYIDVLCDDGQVILSVKNISRDRLNISAEELMGRFVRGDSARSTEGSGLGLSIARSLTELQKGRFAIAIDGDLFKACASFEKFVDPTQKPGKAEVEPEQQI